jgi:hypothetical protein
MDHWKNVGSLPWHPSHQLIEISCGFFSLMIRVGVQMRRAGLAQLSFLACVIRLCPLEAPRHVLEKPTHLNDGEPSKQCHEGCVAVGCKKESTTVPGGLQSFPLDCP